MRPAQQSRRAVQRDLLTSLCGDRGRAIEVAFFREINVENGRAVVDFCGAMSGMIASASEAAGATAGGSL